MFAFGYLLSEMPIESESGENFRTRRFSNYNSFPNQLDDKGGVMKVIKVVQIKKELQVRPIFAGDVTMQTIIDTSISNRFAISHVNFDKGARNKFHTHSIEQILIITEGKGIVATEKHWHGATKDSTFSHLYVMAPEQKTTLLED
jgi:quercetin dioxygenase-like cupin family protein